MSQDKKPEWLSQVPNIAVSAQHAAGRTEVGAVLAAVADEMSQGSAFSVGEVVGVCIERAGTVEHAVMVSTGDNSADRIQLAGQYGVEVTQVSLMSAAEMLKQCYRGVATCVAVN